jgi:glycosyltransferase involved in cell wall biosynthesis
MKLSVCITTFQRSSLLDRTLASVAAQERMPDEVIVSDDCSSDDTRGTVEKWRTAFPSLLYRRNERNLGMPANLNFAVKACSGEYIANLHDGDIYSSDLLAEWEEALDRHPTAGLVFCGLANHPTLFKKDGGVLLFRIAPLTGGREFFDRHMIHSAGSPIWGTVMARRRAYELLLPFDEKFVGWADVDMWMRMCLHFDIAYVNKPLIHLDHTPGAVRTQGRYNWRGFRVVRQIHLENIHRFFAEDPGRLEEELGRHRRLWARFLVARLLGRLRRLDLEGARQGMRTALEWKREDREARK